MFKVGLICYDSLHDKCNLGVLLSKIRLIDDRAKTIDSL